MPALFAAEFKPSNTHVARGVGGAVSVAAQVALGIAILSISSATAPRVTRTSLPQPRLVTAVFLPAPELETPGWTEIPPLREVEAVESVMVPEPAPERPSLVAVRTFENKAVPTPAANEVRPVDVAPGHTLPLPAPPPTREPAAGPPSLASNQASYGASGVASAKAESREPEKLSPSVGAFQTAATIARKPESAQRAETAGFDAPLPHASQSRLGQTAVGSFDAAPAPGPRESGAANQRGTVVIETGFNQSGAASAPTQQSRVVREGGFGTSSNRDRPAVQDRPAPQPASFNDARVVEPARRADVAKRAPAVVAVEVLSKPTPVYTDEARRLKVEGVVVLEVEFCASGQVRVVRVVRGLGHGLDESALVAAQRIQFKPATSEGRPVDYRTTVQIVFRLA